LLLSAFIPLNDPSIAAFPESSTAARADLKQKCRVSEITLETGKAIIGIILNATDDSLYVRALQTPKEIASAPLLIPTRAIPLTGIASVRCGDSIKDGILAGILAVGAPSALITALAFASLADDPSSHDDLAALRGLAYGLSTGGTIGAVMGAILDVRVGGWPVMTDGDGLRDAWIGTRHGLPESGRRKSLSAGAFVGLARSADPGNSRQWRPLAGGRLSYRTSERLTYEIVLASSEKRDKEKIQYLSADAMVPFTLGRSFEIYYSSGIGLTHVEKQGRYWPLKENHLDINVGGGIFWKLPKVERFSLHPEYKWHPFSDQYHEITVGIVIF
jgi:opacity protein-like surface antigen